MEFEFYGYEDTPDSDALFSAASEHALGKKPKATQWYQQFKVLAIQTYFIVAANELRRRYYRVYSNVPKRYLTKSK